VIYITNNRLCSRTSSEAFIICRLFILLTQGVQFIQLAHAALTCSMDTQHGQWTRIIDMQHGHGYTKLPENVSCTRKRIMYMKMHHVHENASCTWKWTMHMKMHHGHENASCTWKCIMVSHLRYQKFAPVLEDDHIMWKKSK
jgi:hypothetical protein